MDINEIRLVNLRGLAVRAGGRPALATRMEMSYQLLQNYIGKTPVKRIGDKTARRAEEVFGLPHGWMDATHDDGKIARATPSGWPFHVERARFDALPESEKLRVGRFLKDTIEAWEQEHAFGNARGELTRPLKTAIIYLFPKGGKRSRGHLDCQDLSEDTESGCGNE